MIESIQIISKSLLNKSLIAIYILITLGNFVIFI